VKSVAIIIPAFNEEACLRELAERLRKVIGVETNYKWEIVIVDNGSTDQTWEEILKISAESPFVKGIKLSRNFLMDGGITAGLDGINSDACILMCADLQDPPELIPDFLRKWEAGYENVYGVVTERQGTNLLRRFNSSLFYKVAAVLTHVKMPQNASDFRLVDRKVYEAVRNMNERKRFMRGCLSFIITNCAIRIH
jgi:dolichol-phosphate mannosyltransferase